MHHDSSKCDWVCCVTLVYYELWYITKHRHTQFLCLIYYLCSSAVRWWVSAHLPWSWFSCYRTMVNCRAFDKVGCQIGVGKESGIFPYPVMQILFLYYSNVGCQIRVWKNTVFLFQMQWPMICFAWLCHLSKVTLCKCFFLIHFTLQLLSQFIIYLYFPSHLTFGWENSLLL